MFCLVLAVTLFSCESDTLETDTPEQELLPSTLVFNRKSGSEMTQLLKKQGLSFLLEASNESAKSNKLYLGDVLETIDSLDNKNYSFNFNIENQKENEFYNLVLNKASDGIDAEPFVLKFISEESSLDSFVASSFDFYKFTGTIERYTLNSFLNSSSFTGKSGEPCDFIEIDNIDTVDDDAFSYGDATPPGGWDSGTQGDGGFTDDGCTMDLIVTHKPPGSNKTFVFGPDSVCQHNFTCEIVFTLVQDCNGPATNKSSGSDCPSANGPVGINIYTSIIDTFSTDLDLSPTYRNFLRERRNESLLTELSLFYHNNGKTLEAKNELSKQIAIAYSLGNGKLKPVTGKIATNDAFAYTHKDTSFDNGKGVLYQLESGLFLAEYGSKRGINGGTVFDQDVSLSHNGKFYYAYNPDEENDYGVVNGYSLGWYEVIIPSESTNTGFENALITALWEGAEFTGRYVLPVEDALIMIDGKDFDGVEQNRVKAAGFFLVGLVPGGKITKAFKPLAKIVKSSEAWATVIKWGDRSHVLKFKLVNGVVDFGRRTDLGKILKTTSGVEAHHLIPWTRGGAHDVIQEAAHAGFHLNMVQNGLGLKKYTKLIGEGLHGNHPAYDSFVVHRLNNFAQNSYDSESALKYLLDTLIPELKNLLVRADNSNMNLNDYFKHIVNPSEGVPGF
jgi:hypothetical protein